MRLAEGNVVLLSVDRVLLQQFPDLAVQLPLSLTLQLLAGVDIVLHCRLLLHLLEEAEKLPPERVLMG